jgi:hypothetical protein
MTISGMSLFKAHKNRIACSHRKHNKHGAKVMFNIVKTTLAVAAVLGSMSLAPVQALAAHHRHPAQAYQDEYGPQYPSFESRNANLPAIDVPGPAEEQWFDRATQSFGGGK